MRADMGGRRISDKKTINLIQIPEELDCQFFAIII
jgi:hypothetical protein